MHCIAVLERSNIQYTLRHDKKSNVTNVQSSRVHACFTASEKQIYAEGAEGRDDEASVGRGDASAGTEVSTPDGAGVADASPPVILNLCEVFPESPKTGVW